MLLLHLEKKLPSFENSMDMIGKTCQNTFQLIFFLARKIHECDIHVLFIDFCLAFFFLKQARDLFMLCYDFLIFLYTHVHVCNSPLIADQKIIIKKLSSSE